MRTGRKHRVFFNTPYCKFEVVSEDGDGLELAASWEWLKGRGIRVWTTLEESTPRRGSSRLKAASELVHIYE
jgi:hypothetical protein